MNNITQIEGAPAYSDGVIAYHQYRAECGLSIPEAVTHPDTQEEFLKLAEVVANSPELVLAYTGVLKARGKRRADALEAVRIIETDIIEGQYDVEAITSAKHTKELKALQDNKVITQRAETFVKLFKSVLPKEQLLKRRTRKSKKQNEIKPADIEQALQFHLSIDQDETIFINNKKPLFAGAQDIIFRMLLDESIKSDDAITPAQLKQADLWKQYISGDEYSSHRLFTVGMRSLRQTLENEGFGGMIEQAGGRGRSSAYRMKMNSFTQEADTTPLESDLVIVEQPTKIPQQRPLYYESDTELISNPTELEIEKQTERSRQELIRDMRFAASVVRGIANLEASEGSHGIQQSRLAKMTAEILNMEPEAVVHMHRQLRDSGDLFISSKKQGHRYLSSQAPVESESNVSGSEQNGAKAETERLKNLKEQYGTQILRFLSGLSHREQTEYKTAIADAVEGLEVGDVNAVCNLLRAEGLVSSKEEQGRGSRRTRKGKTWAVTGRGRSLVSQEDSVGRLTNAQKRSYAAGFRQ